MQGKAGAGHHCRTRTYLPPTGQRSFVGGKVGTSYYTYLGTLGTDLIPDLPCYYTSPTVPVPHVLHLHPPDCHEIEPRDDDISTSYLLSYRTLEMLHVPPRRVASVGERAPARLIPHHQPPTDTWPHIHYVMASAPNRASSCVYRYGTACLSIPPTTTTTRGHTPQLFLHHDQPCK